MEDAPLRHKWFADPQVTRYLPLAGKGELPMEEIRDYLEMVIDSTRPVFDVSIDLLDGTTIGSASYRDIIDGESAELSIVIGEADARGRGLGREVMELMLHYGFDEMKLECVWLVVRADNEAGVALFESLGFQTVEVLEDAVVIDDVPYDKLRMELKRQDWTRHTHTNGSRHEAHKARQNTRSRRLGLLLGAAACAGHRARGRQRGVRRCVWRDFVFDFLDRLRPSPERRRPCRRPKARSPRRAERFIARPQ